MKKPDWSKAPEWADSFGLLGIDKHDAWVSLKLMKYQYLEGSKVYQFGTKGTFYLEDLHLCESRPTQWRGPEDGLPPVGTVCEIAASTPYLKIDQPEGAQVKVYAHFTDDRGVKLAAYADTLGSIGGIAIAKVFRPIKTQEQREIEAVMHDLDEAFEANKHSSTLVLAEFLHAKGYRKP